jgi:prepilin-type N-terminal cleavage/methylation domain-containing protein
VLIVTPAGRHRSQPAFTIVEILVVLTILAIIGALLVRVMLSQGRFTDQQNALRGARMVSRQALNILESEIRMVQDSGGIDSASTDGKTIRLFVPYRFGLNCGVFFGKTFASMLPIDSLAAAQAKYAGFAWRDHVGIYHHILPPAPLGADSIRAWPNASECSGSGAGQAQLKTLTINGRSGQVFELRPAQAAAPKGQAVFVFQRLTYTFMASTAFPGQFGLFRTVQGGGSEEIMAPFDSTARFKYWTRSATASVSAPPALPLIRGIDIVFAGRSSYTPMGKSAPAKSTVVATIFFKNVR